MRDIGASLPHTHIEKNKIFSADFLCLTLVEEVLELPLPGANDVAAAAAAAAVLGRRRCRRRQGAQDRALLLQVEREHQEGFLLLHFFLSAFPFVVSSLAQRNDIRSGGTNLVCLFSDVMEMQTYLSLHPLLAILFGTFCFLPRKRICGKEILSPFAPEGQLETHTHINLL